MHSQNNLKLVLESKSDPDQFQTRQVLTTLPAKWVQCRFEGPAIWNVLNTLLEVGLNRVPAQ